ncbi:hypothetical protein B1R32_11917 [Abditibacterium utsteinense]|uniref:Uncharacterized protein n=1 Tax=Abditibacterium utsteinense TaxID=1960156 RepID=A0A2S8SQ02_9BACT|nr:hypothetical protein [Abditibacterium utsteinense]PQV62877.1 hypothetical protein B1R32_11917 [Abditibacterium utsteinense]
MNPNSEIVPSAVRNSRSGPFLLLIAMGIATAAICFCVAVQVPLWGRVAWGIHQVPRWTANLPLLFLLLGLWGLHAFWTRPSVTPAFSPGKIAALCVLAFSIGLSGRFGESAGLGRLAIITVNPASGGFFEAAYDSRNDPDWLKNYPALMKRHHHVHSHPPLGVGLMRWWLAQRSSGLTSAADDFLAFSPGTNCATLAQLAASNWKRPYTADDIGAAFWAGMMWLAFAALVPAGAFVATHGIFGARAAIHSAALSCAVPSFVLFVPGADLSYIFFAATSLALAVVGFKKAAQVSGKVLLSASGVVAAIGVTGSFAGAWTIVLIVLFLALRGGETRRSRWLSAAIFGGAAAVSLLILQLLGVKWLLFWRSLIAFNVDADVAPLLRFVYHLADFFTFFGVAASVLLFLGLKKWARRASDNDASDDGLEETKRDFLALTVPTLSLMLLLNIVISMAETARIWMFFMPALLVALGGLLARWGAEGNAPQKMNSQLANWTLALHLVQTWIFTVYLNVWSL